MTRKEAKIIGKMTNEQLRAIGKFMWIKNHKFIIAYGNGERVLFDGDGGLAFISSNHRYSIARPVQTINGIECPMHETEMPKREVEYFTPSLDNAEFYVQFSVSEKGGDTYDNLMLVRKLMYLKAADAAKVSKAMMGLE